MNKIILIISFILPLGAYSYSFYDKHDLLVRKNNDLALKGETSLIDVYGVGVSNVDNDFTLHLKHFFKNLKIDGYKYNKDKVSTASENFIKSTLSSENKNTLERNLIKFINSIGINKKSDVRKVGYLILFKLNLQLKVLGAYGVEWKGLDHLLLQTYYVANKFRALDLHQSLPKFSLYKLLNLNEFSKDIDNQVMYSNFYIDESSYLKANNFTYEFKDKYFSPNIYIINAKNITFKANTLEFHPLALVYAPGTNIKFVKNKYLNLINPNFITSGIGSRVKNIMVSDSDRYLNQSFHFEKFIKIVKRQHCDFTTSTKEKTIFTFDFNVKHSKPFLAPRYDEAMNGGNITANADKMIGITHFDASGANGNNGVDGQSSLSCIGSTFVKIPVLNGKYEIDENPDSIDQNFERVLKSHGKALRFLEMPGKAGDGQHGGHGGTIEIKVSSKQLKNNGRFLDFSKSTYGKGGASGKVSKCSNPYFHKRNNFKGKHGLDGAYGKILNTFVF